MDHRPSTRAAFARDAALMRLRRATRALVAVSVALAGIFAGVAAASTHPRKLVRRSVRTVVQPTTTVSPATTTASSDDQESPPATVTPSQPPVVSPSPPVVVSGGS